MKNTLKITGIGVMLLLMVASTSISATNESMINTTRSPEFLIFGFCFYEDGFPMDPVEVRIINLDTEVTWTATIWGNYYTLYIAPGEDFFVDDTLRIIAIDDVEDPQNVGLVDYVVTQEDIYRYYILQYVTTHPVQPGDCNFDGMINAFDIDPFVLGLTDPQGYYSLYCVENYIACDCNGDELVNAFDIDPFVQLLTQG